MKKLFEKNEVTFAIVLIVVYVLTGSVAINIDTAGTWIPQFIASAVMAAVIGAFAVRNGLSRHLGLCAPEVPAAKMLMYIPLLLVACRSVLAGVGTDGSTAALITRTLHMLLVGFIEEVIFRGFLFRGIARDNMKRAVIISSLTFGIGHIVNLLNGSDIADNLRQIVYAVAVGFMLVVILLRTGSIIPCIVFHSLNNMLTGFADGHIMRDIFGSRAGDMILLCVGLVVASGYTVYLWKALPERELD